MNNNVQPATDPRKSLAPSSPVSRGKPDVVAAMNAAIGASVGASELAAWSGCTMRVARAWLGEMSNVRRGRRLFTTVPWLAEWLAQNVKNRPRITHFDPLQKTVGTLAAWTVGELQRQGRIAVLPLPLNGIRPVVGLKPGSSTMDEPDKQRAGAPAVGPAVDCSAAGPICVHLRPSAVNPGPETAA